MYATTTTPSDTAFFETLQSYFGYTAKTRLLQFIYLHGGGDSLTDEISYKVIALHLAHSVRHVKRVVRQLTKAGFIEVHRHQSATNGHHANRYTFTEALRSLFAPGDSPQRKKPAPEPVATTPPPPSDSPQRKQPAPEPVATTPPPPSDSPQRKQPAPEPVAAASAPEPTPTTPPPPGDSPQRKQPAPEPVAAAPAPEPTPTTPPPPGDSPQHKQPSEPRSGKPASLVTRDVVVVFNITDFKDLKNYYYKTTGRQPSAQLSSHFKKWLKTFDRAYIEEKIDALAEYNTYTTVNNPVGFLHKALRDNWTPNGPSLPKKSEDMDDEEWFLGGYK
jgi:hypothetical protein